MILALSENLNNVIIAGIIVFVLIGILMFAIRMYKKVVQGKVLVRTGIGGTKVAFNGLMVYPGIHKMEVMDISVKKVEIERLGDDGLLCRDNMRADIKVAFFVRVNKSKTDIVNVAQTIGCARASDKETLENLFEAKFSEALKTVGKKFEFTQLYEARREFRDEIINIIGTDLNGYILDDCAIDYLEQTPLTYLKPDNILDAEGIKKITELTAAQNMKANLIRREEEKVIRKQDVEAREAILELNRQLSEKEEKQKREVANITAREQAETQRVNEEERLKAESARIATSEELAIAEENMERQIVVARKNKERTEVVETERVEKDRALEQTERERIVTLAQIEKQKVIETEQRNIQEVIRERVEVEKSVVEEKEKIKDVEAFKAAAREKEVAITKAQQRGEELLIQRIKEAEAQKEAAKREAEEKIIEAEASKEASVKEAEARKTLAEAQAQEEATIGLSEAQVIHAKADAEERMGTVEAILTEKQALAEAKGIEAKAEALKLEGISEAEVMRQKAEAEAAGIEQKAEAMKKLDGVGKEHEEFKLQLDKEKQIELAEIGIQKEIADAQALVLAEALKAAKIDIVGGETMFFDSIVNQVTRSKGFDRLINHSENALDIKNAILGEDNDGNGILPERLRSLVNKYGVSSDDIKNLSISALLLKLHSEVGSDNERETLNSLMTLARQFGVGGKMLSDLK